MPNVHEIRHRPRRYRASTGMNKTQIKLYSAFAGFPRWVVMAHGIHIGGVYVTGHDMTVGVDGMEAQIANGGNDISLQKVTR